MIFFSKIFEFFLKITKNILRKNSGIFEKNLGADVRPASLSEKSGNFPEVPT